MQCYLSLSDGFQPKVLCTIMRAIQACAPGSPHLFGSPSYCSSCWFLWPRYKCSSHGVFLSSAHGKDPNVVIDELSPLRTAFPVLLKSIQITLAIAVSTAHCECSFSALKCIKRYLQSTMTQQRLVDLAILSIVTELSRNLSLLTMLLTNLLSMTKTEGCTQFLCVNFLCTFVFYNSCACIIMENKM